MEPTGITVEMLRSIRGEIHTGLASVRQEVAEVRQEVAEVRSGLEAFGRRVIESEVRTSTALVELAGTLRDTNTMLRQMVDLRPRVE